jgi:hypothetical protein
MMAMQLRYIADNAFVEWVRWPAGDDLRPNRAMLASEARRFDRDGCDWRVICDGLRDDDIALYHRAVATWSAAGNFQGTRYHPTAVVHMIADRHEAVRAMAAAEAAIARVCYALMLPSC